jgi:hypothetical protein
MPIIPQALRGLRSKASPGQKCKTLFEKYLKQKRATGMVQVIESLPSKCEALSSSPNTTKIK